MVDGLRPPAGFDPVNHHFKCKTCCLSPRRPNICKNIIQACVSFTSSEKQPNNALSPTKVSTGINGNSIRTGGSKFTGFAITLARFCPNGLMNSKAFPANTYLRHIRGVFPGFVNQILHCQIYLLALICR